MESGDNAHAECRSYAGRQAEWADITLMRCPWACAMQAGPGASRRRYATQLPTATRL
ncbi:hypothetical protein [Kitasatospora sp. NPDC087314]|uniref:hypothetical protein n=1 Tax=Kitasatospora sp. NPDC087314 TaxID=3364068 RepID=UPI003823B224